MSTELVAALTLAVFGVALLYASVGHAGASGYIAVLALFSVGADAIRPTALMLNVLVASIATLQFWRAGHFRWALFWPVALLAVPLAFVGGALALPAPGLKLALGMVLLFAAANFLSGPPADEPTHPPARAVVLGAGAGLGLLAGVTGTGGGIFLTPLLVHARWAPARTAAAVSAPFILCNSLAGLAGSAGTASWPALPLWPLAIAVVAGGALGAHLGSRRFPPATIKRVLAAVLAVAGGKLVLTAA